MLVETVSLTGQLGHPVVGTGPGRSRPVGAEKRVLSCHHSVGRGEGSQLGDKGPFWTLRRTHEHNRGKERGRVDRHGHHLLDGAQSPGQCHPRTGGASCSQPQGLGVSGSKSGVGLCHLGFDFCKCVYVCVCVCVYIYIYINFSGCAGSTLQYRLFSHCGEWELLSSCGAQASHCGGFSCCDRAPGRVGSVAVAPGLQGTGSVAVVPRLSCSAACGIFPGSIPCLLHWQQDSVSLSHPGKKPRHVYVNKILYYLKKLPK